MSRSRGDVNNDGAIDTLDATAVLSHLVNLEGYILTDPEDLEAADANNDGTVDTLDATYILSHLVNLEGYETFAPMPQSEPEPEPEIPATGVYSLKLEDSKMYLRINDTSNPDYARIGQIIFNLTDSSDQALTTGVSLSGSFNNTIYQEPDFNNLINNNWSVTKKVATTTPALNTNTWLEILTVPSSANAIVLNETYTSIFGTKDMEIHYVEGSNVIEGSDVAPFSIPGVSYTNIQIIS